MLQSGKEVGVEEGVYCGDKGLCREAEWEMNVYFPFQQKNWKVLHQYTWRHIQRKQ